jgi:hypothetical protein
MTDTSDPSLDAAPRSDLQVKFKHRWLLWLGGALLVVIAWNAVITIPAMRALDGEDEATVLAYRRWLVSPSQIVVDVWSVKGSQSMAGMDRMLFKTAEGLQGKSYDTVVLAYRGQTRLIMDGGYFQEIGATRDTQNPVYTMRTMQEHLHNSDGSPAFETWTGGWLGVLGKQLEDHNEFHKRWWVNDALGMPSSAGAL